MGNVCILRLSGAVYIYIIVHTHVAIDTLLNVHELHALALLIDVKPVINLTIL